MLEKDSSHEWTLDCDDNDNGDDNNDDDDHGDGNDDDDGRYNDVRNIHFICINCPIPKSHSSHDLI